MTIKEVAEKYNITQDTLRYYEKVGVIPKVNRTPGGIRNYGEEDISWLELALCMRNAGLPVEAIAMYVKLYKQGNSTIPDRLKLLTKQMEVLETQRSQIEETITRLSYKIEMYKKALDTGNLEWK